MICSPNKKLVICYLAGLQSSRSNPSIQATLNKITLSSSLNSHPQTSAASASALHPSLRLFSLSNPSLPTTNLSGPSRRRQPPVSPLTLSPGPDVHQGFSRQLSSSSPLNPYPASQVKKTLEPPPFNRLSRGDGFSSSGPFGPGPLLLHCASPRLQYTHFCLIPKLREQRCA